jgi:hypothetical protein
MDCEAAIDLMVGEMLMGVTDDEQEIRMEQDCCRNHVLESGVGYLMLAENHALSVHYLPGAFPEPLEHCQEVPDPARGIFPAEAHPAK